MSVRHVANKTKGFQRINELNNPLHVLFMRQLFLPITLLFVFIGGLSSCVDDVIVVDSNPHASVSWDFWAGARNVEVDGEIFNEGNSFIQVVELEIEMFDDYGDYISTVYKEFVVNLDQGRSTTFAIDVRERHVFTVDVRVNHIR
jgi:hypothetical protein